MSSSVVGGAKSFSIHSAAGAPVLLTKTNARAGITLDLVTNWQSPFSRRRVCLGQQDRRTGRRMNGETLCAATTTGRHKQCREARGERLAEAGLSEHDCASSLNCLQNAADDALKRWLKRHNSIENTSRQIPVGASTVGFED